MLHAGTMEASMYMVRLEVGRPTQCRVLWFGSQGLEPKFQNACNNSLVRESSFLVRCFLDLEGISPVNASRGQEVREPSNIISSIPV